MLRTLIFTAFLCLNTPALAQNLFFAEDLKECSVESIAKHKAGKFVPEKSFDGKHFTGVEHSCTMSESVTRADMNSSDMLVRVAYCEEPEAVYPTMFVLRWEKSDMDNELNILHVWEGSEGHPRIYYDCQN